MKRSGKSSLLSRFPGIDGEIGRSVAQYARAIGVASQVQVWHDIRPARDNGLPGPWICYLHCRADWITPELSRFPLIPDSANKRPDKQVSPHDTPTEFNSLAECEREAELALAELETSIFKCKPKEHA